MLVNRLRMQVQRCKCKEEDYAKLFHFLRMDCFIYTIDIKLSETTHIVGHICYSFFGRFLSYIRPLNLNLLKND